MRVSNSAPGKGEGGNTVPKVSIGLKIEIPAGWPRVSTMQGAESRLGFSPLLLVGSDAETSTQWASCCSATTPTPPGYSGVAPTGFRGLMQPFFSWKDAHLNRSREAKGRREVPFNSLAQYPGKLQLQNCILGALRATSPCGGEFQGNFCRGFKLQVEKKPLRCTV